MPHPDVPPIGAEEIRDRQVRARTLAGEAGFDALLVVGRSFYDRPGDLAYLTNHFPPFPTTVFSDGNRGMGHAAFLLPVEGEPTLLTDARRHRPDLVVVDDVRATNDLGEGIIDLLREKELTRSRVGLAGADILPAVIDWQLAAALPDLQLEEEISILPGMRSIKSPAELALMRRAALCADAALMTAVEMIRAGNVTEREVCADAIAAAMREGADFVRYFRVHSGTWSAMGSRWPQAMNKAIEPGEVVALDAIGAYQGYGFDVNRTTAGGRLDERHLALLETTLAATQAAVDATQAGVTVDSVAQAAQRVMDDSPFGDYVRGMLGHAIGLETVELPYLRLGEVTELRAGM
ncbi:MAG: aminopeptidase P family protein, partial [Thermomicrobiales bacterium]|nr:aminopeptidase P family protein [Thermomicrobiales bacterium]